jgi:hypothetical protein
MGFTAYNGLEMFKTERYGRSGAFATYPIDINSMWRTNPRKDRRIKGKGFKWLWSPSRTEVMAVLF